MAHSACRMPRALCLVAKYVNGPGAHPAALAARLRRRFSSRWTYSPRPLHPAGPVSNSQFSGAALGATPLIANCALPGSAGPNSYKAELIFDRKRRPLPQMGDFQCLHVVLFPGMKSMRDARDIALFQ